MGDNENSLGQEPLNINVDLGGASPERITYRENKHGDLIVRRVIKFGKNSGEFHIKSKSRIRPEVMVGFFNKHFPDYEIGLTDPGNILGLEHPVYMKMPMILDDEDVDYGFDKVSEAFNIHVKELMRKQHKGE